MFLSVLIFMNRVREVFLVTLALQEKKVLGVEWACLDLRETVGQRENL